MKLPKLSVKDLDKFWRNISQLTEVDSCWEWQGGKFHFGHGAFRVGKWTYRTHRIAFFLYYATDPGILCVCHRCDNPPCCNPHHLFLGSRKDNGMDRDNKNRTAKGDSNGNSRLKEKDVLVIRASKNKHGDIAEEFNVSQSLIEKIKGRVNWKHI